MDEEWYAVYTKPRWEKKVAETLVRKNFVAFCPINKVIRQWSDRKKTVNEPLFTSYVFVHLTKKQISEVKNINGVKNLVYWLGKPAVIKEEEITIIKQFINEYQNVKLEKARFKINESVLITSGSLIDRKGTVIAIKNNTIKVALPSLNCIMYADIVNSSAVKIAQ